MLSFLPSSFSCIALHCTSLHRSSLLYAEPSLLHPLSHHEQAETRAVQMSTISAKSFAQSARTIAYLEGECGRLKTMLDHFRLVNDKMMCDIRIAREEGMNQKCLEHRLKLTVENEGVLQGRDCMEICLCFLFFSSSLSFSRCSLSLRFFLFISGSIHLTSIFFLSWLSHNISSPSTFAERLRITEGQLRAKERDSMLSLQQVSTPCVRSSSYRYSQFITLCPHIIWRHSKSPSDSPCISSPL